MSRFDARMDVLIDGWRDGSLSPADARELEAALRDSPALREHFREEARLHGLLHAAARAAAVSEPGRAIGTDGRAAVPASARRMSIAAAFLCGLAIPSAAWGFGVVASTLLGHAALVWQESFEAPGLSIGRTFPDREGEWGGVEATIVPAGEDVQPVDHAKMVRIPGDSLGNHETLNYGIDLRRLQLPSGTSRLTLSARYATGPTTEPSRFLLRAATFDRDLTAIDPQWMGERWGNLDDIALSRHARGGKFDDPDGDGWQRVTLTVDVHPEATLLVIGLRAVTIAPVGRRADHYIDDVRLELADGRVVAGRLP